MPSVYIREESKADRAAIRQVTEIAFRNKPYTDGDEQDVIDRLRSSHALALSLVAVENDEILGQITFSPAIVEDDSKSWFALGPVSVTPSRQGEGIGSSLIKQGLAGIDSLGALGCILTGNPEYYKKFGFKLAPKNSPINESELYFQLKLLGGELPEGRFAFHRAFYEGG